MTKLNFKLSEHLAKQLQEKAKKEKLDIDKLIQYSIRNYLSQ